MLKIVNLSRKVAGCSLWQHHKGIVSLTTRSFKSDLSLDKLYPNSKQTIFTPTLPPVDKEKFNGVVPLDQLQISYDRSSGPGGQNVNKVNTKVDLRFHLKNATWLSDNIKERISEQHSLKINKEGFLIIKSDVTRYQQMNLADALEKLRNIIREAEKPIKIELAPEKLEKIRKKQEKAAQDRLKQKRERSQTKADRQAPKVDF